MAAATRKQQPPPQAAAASTGGPAVVVDPKFDCAEKAGSYVLRLALPGFTKDDFRVQVNGAGRLTVRGARPGMGAAALNKVFQLPSAADLDGIAGRFEAGVLTLTVSKRASSATAPTSVEEIRTKLPGVATPKEEDALKKKEVTDEATKKIDQQQRKQEEEASKSKQEQQKPAPAEVNKEEVKPKAPQAPATAPPPKPAPVKKEEDMKPKVPQAAAAATTPQPPETEKAAPKPEAATGSEKAKAVVAPESLADRVRRHGKEQRAKAAAMAAEKEATAEREKKATAACVGGWKERAMGELKGLTNMKWAEGLTDRKWADGVVEKARNNKEVLAVGIAAFSIGFLVSQKLFRK